MKPIQNTSEGLQYSVLVSKRLKNFSFIEISFESVPPPTEQRAAQPVRPRGPVQDCFDRPTNI